MDVWKEHCLDYGLSGVNSTTQSYDKTSEAKRLVALCVPIGADADGNEVIGDLYTVFYDKDVYKRQLFYLLCFRKRRNSPDR